MKRFGILLTGYCAIGAVVIPALVRPVPRLVWNASASVPIGLYAARPSESVKRGDLVAAHAPTPIAQLMAARGYLPLRVPMLKHVLGVAGQTVCRTGLTVTIDGTPVAEVRPRDRMGRPLPSWSGCRRLRQGEVFLLNPGSPDSFDGRYFGPVPARGIVAILTPLWLPGRGETVPPSAPAAHESSSVPKPQGESHDQHR
ncbi:S26 family signal peptidase [Sphingomonas sp. G-3-2-10]|uniref:S26 family signal peptidase n=1 Tax=Sphingomonas sp. G-3-2-10 TaxID=2728838 RepID=UPI00146BFBC1|nr:S26 family signal peptidase [Sphingomonas sp. G-3-2-10]NML06771.1 S26 family signal peptidase [Sphingomonas sp. G-3-2-10]